MRFSRSETSAQAVPRTWIGNRQYLAILICTLLCAVSPQRANAEVQHVLQIETGGHQGAIKALVLTPDGKEVISAGDDKIVRVWDAKTGRTIRTIRGYVQPGQTGKIFALALSPDGKWLATAGWMDDADAAPPCCGDVRLYDYATGKLVALLKGHENAVYDLAFSEDGQWLASAGADQTAIVWDLETRQEHARLGQDQGHTDRIVKVAFTDGGHSLVTASYDGFVKMWSVGEKKWMRDIHQHPARVYGLAVSSDGRRIASGDAKGEIKLWMAEKDASITLGQQKISIGALSFNTEGSLLLSSCGYRCPDNPGQVVWDTVSGKVVSTYKGHDGSVAAAALSGDGTRAVTGGGDNNQVHIWNARTGEVEAVLKGHGQPITAVGVSKDRTRVAWGIADPCPDLPLCPNKLAPLVVEAGLPSAKRNFAPPVKFKGPDADFLRAIDKTGSIALTLEAGKSFDRKDATLVVKDAQRATRKVTRDETSGFGHTAYTLIGKGDLAVSGGEHGALSSFKTKGDAQAKNFIGHTGQVTAIAATADGKLLVTGSLDQTVRLWNAETGELIVSMLFADDGEWVIWTEQGFYDSSPKGDAMVGWQINQGWDKEARFVTARQLKDKLHSPEMIKRAITLGSAAQAVKQLRGTANVLDAVLATTPPAFEISSPAPGANVKRATVSISLALPGDTAQPTRFEAIANGRNVTPADAAVAAGIKEVSFTLPLQPDENKIRIIAYNEAGYTAEREIEITNFLKESEQKPGRLFVAVIGVNNYPSLPPICAGANGSCELKFSVADAIALSNAAMKTIAPKHSSTSVLLLANGGKAAALDKPGATKMDELVQDEPLGANVAQKLAAFLSRAQPEDTTVLFLAGHGINIDEQYYFVPTDAAAKPDGKFDEKTLVSWRVLRTALHSTKGTRFMFVDTCHAGNAYNNYLKNDAEKGAIAVFSATEPNSVAKEIKELAHGAFTFALLQGLAGKADTNKNQTIEVLELASFTASEVLRLTKSAQEPDFHILGMTNMTFAWP